MKIDPLRLPPSLTLARRKSGLPDLRKHVRNPSKLGLRGGGKKLIGADTPNQGAIFAANRAVGAIVLSVEAKSGVTRRARVREDGSLRVRFPGAAARDCEAVIVNTAGGIAGGDRLAFDISVGEGASLVVTTAAAEKVYRSLGPDADIAVVLDVAAGGVLAWLPQETILFDRAHLSRSIDVTLAANASVLLCEAVVFGRAAMGETMTEGRLVDRWRIRRGGALIFAETLRLNGAIAEKLAEPAAGNGAAAVATIFIVPADETVALAVRTVADRFSGEVGISAWNGFAIARLIARDGAALRHDLMLVLAALGRRNLPRLWLN
ncbi:MAG: urease accessory protein UreD [Rhizobiales bacterium]|nr:urease accessory protein UreD [Hyphomicrobiales bacterium]